MTLTKIITTSLKCGLLASFLLVILVSNYEKNIGDERILILFFSTIITSLISFGMILTTIIPFLLYFKKETIFERIFPYYSVVTFIVFTTISLLSKFDTFLFYISIPAFFTALMAWVWLFKDPFKKQTL